MVIAPLSFLPLPSHATVCIYFQNAPFEGLDRYFLLLLLAFHLQYILINILFWFSFTVPPRDSPMINSPKTVYRIGEEFTANCSSFPSRPPATITWTIHDKPVIAIIFIR
jgi:hypothetical protein